MTAQRAAIYCRISEDREGAGLGVGRQEADCREWADRHDWTVAEVYADNDISAYSGKPRPSYRRLLADITAGQRDGLIIWHADRLHRSPAELEEFIPIVERNGLVVGSVTAGDVDLATPSGRLVARLTGAVARHESEHKSERIRRKHRELAENGKVPGGGIRPFGYGKDRKTVIDAEATLIREAASRVLAGDGVRTIAADWQRRGIKTVTGAAWQATTIKRLLQSGRIAGVREHHGDTFPAEWPAIITAAASRDLRRLLKDPARRLSHSSARSYLLSGMVYCGACGARLTAAPVIRKGHRYPRYHCLADRGGCNGVGIIAAPLEEVITEAVLLRLDSAALAAAVAAAENRVSAVVGDVADIEARLEDLAQMFADRDISKAEWAVARSGLVSQLDAARRLEADQVRASAVVAQLVAPDVLRQEWPNLSLDRQRAVIAAIVDRITIAPTTKGNNKFDPDRIDVTWRV